MSTALMLKYFGFEKIMMLDFSEFRLRNARDYGLLTCNPKTEDLQAKLKRMPESAQKKLREALGRIINEGGGGLICIIL